MAATSGSAENRQRQPAIRKSVLLTFARGRWLGFVDGHAHHAVDPRCADSKLSPSPLGHQVSWMFDERLAGLHRQHYGPTDRARLAVRRPAAATRKYGVRTSHGFAAEQTLHCLLALVQKGLHGPIHGHHSPILTHDEHWEAEFLDVSVQGKIVNLQQEVVEAWGAHAMTYALVVQWRFVAEELIAVRTNDLHRGGAFSRPRTMPSRAICRTNPMAELPTCCLVCSWFDMALCND